MSSPHDPVVTPKSLTDGPQSSPAPAPGKPAVPAATRSFVTSLHDGFGLLGAVLPGVVLAIAVALAGQALVTWLGKDLLGFKENPFSEISAAVLLGLLLKNTLGVPAVYERGLKLCSKEILRVGIVLLGLRLSLAAIGKLGLIALPIIVVCILTALVVVTRLNRALGLPARLGSLIAVGTSICGVSAIVATAPVIEAEEDEVSYAVACITLFGLMALFLYPFVAFQLFGPEHPQLAGIFLGTSIHDTSQVAGAGLMYQEQYHAPKALEAATVVKLVRNLSMVGVIPLISALYMGSVQRHEQRGRMKLMHLIPLFVLGFILAAGLRTTGDLGVEHGWLDKAGWKQFLDRAGWLAAWCLVVAMASVGLGTGLGKIRRLGLKPFCVGLAAALLVGGVSVALLKVLGPYL